MNNFPVNNALVAAVRNRLSEDPLKYSHAVSEKRTWIPKLHIILHEFIENALSELDDALAKNYKETDSRKDYFFDEKTLRRAVSGKQSANAALINLLGYYAFRKDWETKRESMFLLPLTNENALSTPEKKVKTLTPKPKKEPYSTLSVFLGIGMISLLLFQLWSYSNNAIEGQYPPLLMAKCKCGIEQIPLESYEIDSVEYKRTSEAIDWKGDKPLKNKIKQFAKRGFEGESPKILEEETQKIIKELQSKFPEHDGLIIELQAFRTYYCVVDQTICKASHFRENEKFDRKNENFKLYRNELSRIFEKNTAHKSISVSGIEGNSPLMNSLKETARLIQSYSGDRTFNIKIETSPKPVSE